MSHKAKRRPGPGEIWLAVTKHDGVQVDSILIDQASPVRLCAKSGPATSILPVALGLQLADRALKIILNKPGVGAEPTSTSARQCDRRHCPPAPEPASMKPDSRDAGGSLEPDRHPRPEVRQPPSLPRVADPVGGADSLEHSGRPADAPGESRIGLTLGFERLAWLAILRESQPEHRSQIDPFLGGGYQTPAVKELLPEEGQLWQS